MSNPKKLLTALEIQKELSKKGKFITLSQIGSIAKQLNMVTKTNLGYNIYDEKLINYIIKEEYEEEYEEEKYKKKKNKQRKNNRAYNPKKRRKHVSNDNNTNTRI